MLALLAAATQEQPAPGWLAPAALAVPVVIMALVLRWAIRGRRRAARHRRADTRRRGSDRVPLSSAESIADGGGYQAEALLTAMAVRPEGHGPAGGMPHDEGWRGTMLGLKSRISASTTLLEPHVYWGRRPAGQVFVRLGPDEKIAGGSVFPMSERHLRSFTVLRVGASEFELSGESGRPARVEGDGLPGGVLDAIAPNPDIWDGLRVVGGPDGVVAIRPSGTHEFGGWAYDLWLLERLAIQAGWPALSDKRIGPAWKVPYGLGR
jgi:hypothetical protein